VVDFVISSNVLPKHDSVDPETSILEFLLAWMNYLSHIEASPIFSPTSPHLAVEQLSNRFLPVSRDFWRLQVAGFPVGNVTVEMLPWKLEQLNCVLCRWAFLSR
jgi:hypothetical protein